MSLECLEDTRSYAFLWKTTKSSVMVFQRCNVFSLKKQILTFWERSGAFDPGFLNSPEAFDKKVFNFHDEYLGNV